MYQFTYKIIGDSSSISIHDDLDDRINTIFIYKRVYINRKDKRILIEFKDDAIYLFEKIRQMPYSTIEFDEILKLENKYQMNLYLYALTILRGE